MNTRLTRFAPVSVRQVETRIRGRKLQSLRKLVLLANPLCAVCTAKGALSLATQVDHIIALCNGGSNGVENLQGLCDTCHADKTRADLGQKPLTKFDSAGRVIW